MTVHMTLFAPPLKLQNNRDKNKKSLIRNLYLVIDKIKGFCKESLDIPDKGNSYNSNK